MPAIRQAALISISFRYWKSHYKRAVSLAAVCILGAAALSFSCLLIRSEKAGTLERMLDRYGDYDGIFYEIEEADVPLISEDERVASCGYYHELGYVGTGGSARFKAASFHDARSEQMYHMTCTEGGYPRKGNEIAIDAETAKKLGIPPRAGEEAYLTLYGMDGREAGSGRYVVSGIIEASSDEVFGGFYRNPELIFAEEEYEVPVVFFSGSDPKVASGTLVTAYFQSDGNVQDVMAGISEKGFETMLGSRGTNGRVESVSQILGMAGHIADVYGRFTPATLISAVRDGTVWKDFYSSVLIPLFAALVLVVVAASVYGTVRDIIWGRSRQMAILRSLGLTRQGSFCYLFAETGALIAAFLLIGMALGGGIHAALVLAAGTIGGEEIPLGFRVGPYVASVTPNPWAYSAFIILASSLPAVAIPLWGMCRKAPVQVQEAGHGRKRKARGARFPGSGRRAWQRLVGRNIRYYDTAAVFIMCVIMCASYFGYNYFRAYADMENASYKSELEESGLRGWDFMAEKSVVHKSSPFIVEGLHGNGVGMEEYESLRAGGLMADSFARIMNKTTKIAYKRDAEPAGVGALMQAFNLRSFGHLKDSVDELDRAKYEGEEAVIEDTGYGRDENVYALPTVGILPEEIERLSPYVEQGKISLDRIAAGEEVLLAVPGELEEAARAAFNVGDALPLSDILLSGEEESFDITGDDQKSGRLAYFKEHVMTPEGADVSYSAYAFGRRHDFKARIGAIAVLGDDGLCDRYLLPGTELGGMDIEAEEPPAYAPCLICVPESFASWGLPDSNFTEVRFSAGREGNLKEANDAFYSTLSGCEGITYSSSYEIRKKMRREEGATMAVYFMMVAALTVLGMFAVGIKFNARIRLNARTTARLRAVGMSLPQIEGLIMRQNAAFPVLGAIVSIPPVAACQAFFRYIARQVDSGAWGGITISGPGEDAPWYHSLPFRQGLISHHPALALAAEVLVFELLMLAATASQIRCLKGQPIARGIDEDSF